MKSDFWKKKLGRSGVWEQNILWDGLINKSQQMFLGCMTGVLKLAIAICWTSSLNVLDVK